MLLEAIGDVGTGRTPTRVLAGKGACPPEDVGGVGGYHQFLEAIQDPTHPEHQEMLDWGGDVEAGAFKIDEVNAYFHEQARKRTNA